MESQSFELRIRNGLGERVEQIDFMCLFYLFGRPTWQDQPHGRRRFPDEASMLVRSAPNLQIKGATFAERCGADFGARLAQTPGPGGR
jgi:hypothetical protein